MATFAQIFNEINGEKFIFIKLLFKIIFYKNHLL
jgi:hypothetical protein